jgi:uncharacterized membrane protein
MKKWGLSIVGIVLVLLGGLWTLQGINIVRNSFMTGKIQYAILGIVMLLIGLALVIWANRRQKGTPTSSGPGAAR